MGGQITWTCNGNGEFVFQVKEYRDCNGIPGDQSITLVTNAPGFISGIFCSKISQTDISPVGIGCPTCMNPMGNLNAVEEFIYESAPTTIVGTPPSSGWYFYYSSCCRNGNIINLSTSGGGNFTLRALMYPSNNLTTNPCYDNSPQFAESPTMAISAGSETSYNEAAFDQDLDSLVYSWGQPLDNGYPGSNYPFTAGYSYSSPLPGPSQNPLNIAAVLNPSTGRISFTSFTQGAFVTVVKVSSYRCNTLIAEVFREIQIAITSNSITANNTINQNSQLYLNSIPADYYDTLLAGDSITIQILANDTDLLSATAGGGVQTITLEAKSPEFGYQYQRTDSGCVIPPCAVLMNPSMPISNPIVAFNSMNWVTACAHASYINGCLQHQHTYFFLFKVKDNMCPVNGISYRTAAITISGPEIYLNGNSMVVSYPGVTLQWYLNGVAIPGATDTIFTPILSGIYTVIATSGNGCEMISSAVNRTFTGTGFENISSPTTLSINVNPNPVINHQLNLIAGSAEGDKVLISILDITGKTVYQNTAELQRGYEHLVIQIGDLVPGIYHLTMRSSKEQTETKIVIQ